VQIRRRKRSGFHSNVEEATAIQRPPPLGPCHLAIDRNGITIYYTAQIQSSSRMVKQRWIRIVNKEQMGQQQISIKIKPNKANRLTLTQYDKRVKPTKKIEQTWSIKVSKLRLLDYYPTVVECA
jgi:hypothetical protein